MNDESKIQFDPIVLAATDEDEFIVAALPRDWSRQVGDVVAAQPRGAAGVADAVRELIDTWVLHAIDLDLVPEDTP